MPRQDDACFNCGGLGHWAADCPRKGKRRQNWNAVASSVGVARAPTPPQPAPGTMHFNAYERGWPVPELGDPIRDGAAGIIGVVTAVDRLTGNVTVALNAENMAIPFVSEVNLEEQAGTEAQWQQACTLWKQLLDVNRPTHANAGLVMEAWLQQAILPAEAHAMLAFLGYDAAALPTNTVKSYRSSGHALTINTGSAQYRLDREPNGLGLDARFGQSPARLFVQGNVGKQLHALGDALAELEELSNDE